MVPTDKSESPEKFYTVKEAASLLGLKYWQLQRAVKRGLVPSYTFGNSRKYVRLSEVIAAFERSRSGVANV
jgi:excisionase family DNA binding protein